MDELWQELERVRSDEVGVRLNEEETAWLARLLSALDDPMAFSIGDKLLGAIRDSGHI